MEGNVMSLETITTELSEGAREIFGIVEMCDGAEIFQADWAAAQELVDVGLITLSGAHGPGNSWKRGELKEQD